MLTANSQTEAKSQEVVWGVISYVPADIAWCEWLYFTLNGYPVPVALMARATRDGFGLPETLTVFPDPADRDYADRYPDALRAGRFLIVLCSPNSVCGETVDGHIRDFKRAGGEERIIVLVVEGEPTSGAGRRDAGPSKWLPPWLRWRLDENGSFKAAERSEPVIIDARPGRMNLDDIMASLLAALLDIPRLDFDVLSGPHPELPERSDANLLEQDGMVDQIWAELAAPARPVESNTKAPATAADQTSLPRRRPLGLIISAILAVMALVGAGVWSLLPSREATSHATGSSGFKTQPSKAGVSNTSPATVGNNPQEVPPPVQTSPAATRPPESLPEANPGPAEIASGVKAAEKNRFSPTPLTAANIPPATTPPPELAPASASENPPVQAPAPGPVTLTPEEIAEQAAHAALKEATEARLQADRMVRSGRVSDALPLYLHALDRTERYAALRDGDSSAELDAAKLCLIVGSLQANYSSTAEARQTLEAGRRLIGRGKAGKSGSDDRSKTLNSIQLQIRHLDDDAPRRRAERD